MALKRLLWRDLVISGKWSLVEPCSATAAGSAVQRLQARYRGGSCEKPEDKKKKPQIVCQQPKHEPKPIPPYEYGFCRDPDPAPPTTCPGKKKEKPKGPCCKMPPKKKGCP